LHLTERNIDTPFWIIELDAEGRLSRVYDKRAQREILPDGQLANRLVVFEDKPLNFDAWDIDPFFASKSRETQFLEANAPAETPRAEGVDRLVGARVLERGPVRGVVELRWRVGERTRISQRLTVYAHVPRIDFVTEVDWQERQSLLKVGFPTRIRNRRATYDIQFGTIDRPTHRNTSWEEAAFEVPAQRWADLSDASSGVALLADCKHGFSVHEDTLWLSLLKGGIDPDPNADRGLHHFTYALLPHGPGLQEVRRSAYALTRPLLGIREPAHVGHLSGRFSLADCEDENVVVETAKWAEDEDALVLRVYEAGGGARRAALQVGGSPSGIAEVDLLERNPRSASTPLEFRAREIKSLLVRYGT
jgi:alpha-mannosidase